MNLSYLRGYPADTVQQVGTLLQEQKLGPWLLKKYPQAHGMRDDRALFAYVQSLKQDYLRGASPLSKVLYDTKLQLAQNALGTHTAISRVQGTQLKAKREIRIAALFKDTPLEFLRMITVHELAHLRERQHDKNFYKLCCYMEPDYHQLEFELRIYLTYLDSEGQRLWS
jgi:predicted metal-dependent hydrolase